MLFVFVDVNVSIANLFQFLANAGISCSELFPRRTIAKFVVNGGKPSLVL